MGRLLRGLIAAGKSFSGRERNCCFLNMGQSEFANVSAISGLDATDDGRAVARIDWDADGDVDFWVVNRSSPQVRYFRNDYQGVNNSLAFKLVGVESNRDAIGARVALAMAGDAAAQQRTVVAGSGYLSQSSRWIHFGLGDSQQIGTVEITWPSGLTQQLSALEPNRRYVVTEGESPVIEPTRRRTPNSSHDKTPPRPGGAVAAVGVLLTTPTPTPRLAMESSDGARVNVVEASGDAEATLLVLWSRSCRPCLVELRELASRYGELQAQSVRVVAAAVDRLESSLASSIDVTPDGATLPAMDAYPYSVGWATADLLDNLQLSQDRLFDLHDRLKLPGSFLLDRDGKLTAVYRGSVSVDRLLADVQAGSLSAEARRVRALPFAGKWSAAVRAPRLLNTGLSILSRGDFHGAQQFYQQYRDAIRPDFQYHIFPYNLAQQFTRRGEHRAALKLYQEALRAAPDLADAHFNLGLSYAALGDSSRAVTHLGRAAELEPENGQAQLQLAKIMMRSGHLAAAAGPLREALRIQPDDAATLFESALLAALSGEVGRANQLYARAAQAAPAVFANSRRKRQIAEAIRIGSSLQGKELNER
ncbi:MAG: ASPIC/UnbV domain-containing protein [Aeoliella sp.]